MTALRRSITVIDWSVLRELFGDNASLRDRLLALFLVESERDLGALDAAFETHDFERVRGVAHQLSGAARTVGALSLAAAAHALEGQAVYEDPALAASLRAGLRARAADVQALISSLQA